MESSKYLWSLSSNVCQNHQMLFKLSISIRFFVYRIFLAHKFRHWMRFEYPFENNPEWKLHSFLMRSLPSPCTTFTINLLWVYLSLLLSQKSEVFLDITIYWCDVVNDDQSAFPWSSLLFIYIFNLWNTEYDLIA